MVFRGLLCQSLFVGVGGAVCARTPASCATHQSRDFQGCSQTISQETSLHARRKIRRHLSDGRVPCRSLICFDHLGAFYPTSRPDAYMSCICIQQWAYSIYHTILRTHWRPFPQLNGRIVSQFTLLGCLGNRELCPWQSAMHAHRALRTNCTHKQYTG